MQNADIQRIIAFVTDSLLFQSVTYSVQVTG